MKKKNKKILIGSIAGVASIALICSISIPLALKNNSSSHSQLDLIPTQPNTVLKESELPTLKKSQFSINELGCQNLSIDQIQQKINEYFFYENREALFDNPNIYRNSITNVNVTKTSPYELTVKFVLNNKEQEIKIIKTIEEEYGEIKPELKQEQTSQIGTFNNSSITVTDSNVARNINNQ